MKKERYALIIYLLLFIVTVTVLLALYHRNEHIKKYETIQSDLEQLKELDLQVDKVLLQNLSFYLSHYDTLVQLNKKTRELQKKTKRQSEDFSHEVPLFKRTLAHYIVLSQEKNLQLERIKALSSSIKNTILYLPTAISQLDNNTLNPVETSVHFNFRISSLMNILLHYNISPGEEKKQLIEKQIKQLEVLSAPEPLHKPLKNILSHIRANLIMTSQIASLLKTYEQINLSKYLIQLQKLHTDYFTQQNENSYQINILLISLSYILFIALGYVIQTLKQAHIRAKNSHAQLYDAMESINEAFALFDHKRQLVLWNKQFELYYPKIKHRLKTGISYSELMYEAIQLGQFRANKKQLDESFTDDIAASTREIEYLSDGRCYLASNSKTSSGGIACVRIDMTDQIKLEEKILWQANFDPLTNLPNRTLFLDRLSQTLQHSKRKSSLCALLFVDLDRFKHVNDTLGHDTGDKLLISVAECLISSVRKIDTVSRLGGDEFTVILQDITSAHDAANIATHIIEKLEEVFIIDDNEIYIGASIGITLYPNDADTPTQMLSNADMSMYRAKEAGRNTYRFYTEEMNKEMLSRLQLEKDMRQALTREEFFIEYQPIIDSQSNKVFHAEALIRWQHPVHGRLAPDRFISLAEETGLIAPMGEWVLTQAVKQVALWQSCDLRPFSISVNVSSRQLAIGNLDRILQKLLNETPLPAGSIALEMTESLLLESSISSRQFLDTFKQLGINLSIDDFGTGYSSLSYLKQFPVDILKIDKSFVRDVTEDADDATLTVAIIDLAHNFNLQVIAEGVETIEQLSFLKQHGCDLIQGFYYSKPLSPEALLHFVQQHNRK